MVFSSRNKTLEKRRREYGRRGCRFNRLNRRTILAPILPNPIIPSCIALPPARSMLRESSKMARGPLEEADMQVVGPAFGVLA